MSQSLEALEAQKSSRSFDRVHGAEDFSQQGTVLRPFLQVCEPPLHAVQPFLALRDKFFSQVVHILYIGRRPLTISATQLAFIRRTR